MSCDLLLTNQTTSIYEWGLYRQIISLKDINEQFEQMLFPEGSKNYTWTHDGMVNKSYDPCFGEQCF